MAGCGRGSFTESAPQLPPRARVTARLRTAAGRAVAVDGRTIAQAARDHGLSWPTVAAGFAREAGGLLPAAPEPVTALGIDETRRGRPRFAISPETGLLERVADRWQCAMRRLVVSPVQPGGTRREVLGSDGLPGSER